jgi:serine protease Do
VDRFAETIAMLVCFSRRVLCSWGFSILMLWGLGPRSALAQATIPASLERPGTMTAERRAELFAELRRHAEVLEAQSAVLKSVAKLVGPSVVHIEADTAERSGLQVGRPRVVEENASGVVIAWAGKNYVLTNRHVIRDAAARGVKINLADGRRIFPDRILEDAETDVAVLPVSAADLTPAPIGDSAKLEIGDFVLAVGSPFGLSQSVTYGIISAKGRRDLELGDSGVTFQDFLQTDAAINPGNSGGPLVNLRGEVVGINTAIASNSGGSEGIGFAIPINMFMNVARQLIDRGTVTRAFMGVNLNAKFGPAMAAELGLPRPMGALVTAVTPDSPAARADLRTGDVILEFDHVAVESDSHLVNMVSMTPVGRPVPVTVFRNRQALRLTIEVSDRRRYSSAYQPVVKP